MCFSPLKNGSFMNEMDDEAQLSSTEVLFVHQSGVNIIIACLKLQDEKPVLKKDSSSQKSKFLSQPVPKVIVISDDEDTEIPDPFPFPKTFGTNVDVAILSSKFQCA